MVQAERSLLFAFDPLLSLGLGLFVGHQSPELLQLSTTLPGLKINTGSDKSNDKYKIRQKNSQA